MKIYILTDMEGISGIRKMEQVKRDSASEYEEGRKLMMADINAAIEGAFAGGATEVIHADTHGGGGQIRLAEMDSRAVYETPGKNEIMPALDESFDGVVLLGHHARAGTEDGFLDHTMDSMHWFRCMINETEVGEIGIEAAYAGHYDVPVIAVSGDEKTGEEAKALLGEVECAVVKWGVGRNRAKCLSLEKAHKIITDTVKTAVENIKKYKPYKPSLPAKVTLTLYRSDYADEFSRNTATTRLDARTVQRTIDSLKNVHRW